MIKLTPPEIKQLKSKLPYGSIRKIAEKLDLSETHVSLVLNNKVPYNQKIIKVALDIIEDIENKEKEIRHRLEKLSSKAS